MVHQEWVKLAYTLMSIAESFSNTVPIPSSVIERVKHQLHHGRLSNSAGAKMRTSTEVIPEPSVL